MPMMNEINLKVNVTYGDTSLNDQNSDETKLVMFILWGIILPLVATAGLVGNILTIIVLWRKEMHSTTILYLRGLVITDTGILIGSVITLTPISCANYLHGEPLDYFKDSIYPVIHTPGYYIIMTLQQCNVWITVSVSMERYIAICHPFRAARLITRRKTIIVMVVIVIVSLMYNIPHLFATTALPCASGVTPIDQPDIAVVNGSGDAYGVHVSSTSSPLVAPPVSSSGCLEVGTTSFGNTEFYHQYRTIMYSIIIYVIPFLALLVLNSFLIKELMTMQRRRSGTNIHDENEANLSLVLVLIVIVFIFCQTPGLISQFDKIPIHVFWHWLAVSNLLFTTNSAVNFLIYTAFGRKFRKVLLRVFRHFFTKKGDRRQSMASYRLTQYTTNDFDTCDASDTNCTSMRSMSCYKRGSTKSTGDTLDPCMLNTKLNASSNGSISHNVNGNNNGSKRALLAKLNEGTECETLCSKSTENMEIIPLTSDIKDDVTYMYYNKDDKDADNGEENRIVDDSNEELTISKSEFTTEQIMGNSGKNTDEDQADVTISSNGHTPEIVANGKEL